MNFEEFIITVTISFLTGVGFGLVINSVCKFLLKLFRIIRGKPEFIKSVKFSKYFNTNEE